MDEAVDVKPARNRYSNTSVISIRKVRQSLLRCLQELTINVRIDPPDHSRLQLYPEPHSCRGRPHKTDFKLYIFRLLRDTVRRSCEPHAAAAGETRHLEIPNIQSCTSAYAASCNAASR
jgi:hypothetical protein